MELTCPSCGASVPARLAHSKLVVCAYCNTSLFLEDQAVKQAGVKSVLADYPSIFAIGRRFRYESWLLTALGRVRFDYGDGFWDEWWMLLEGGGGRWLSVDEGDIAIETLLEVPGAAPDIETLGVGDEVRLPGVAGVLRVTEKQEAICLGMEGELPEVSFPGDVHRYVHLSGKNGLLVTGEAFDGRTVFYQGAWVDPFEVEALPA